MKTTTHIKQPNRENAQGMVEFALILPVLLLIVLGLIETGRLIFIYSSVTNAAREAARYGSATGNSDNGIPRFMDCAEIIDAAVRVGFLGSVQPGDVTITYDNGPGTASLGGCPPNNAAIQTGTRILVEVESPFDTVIPGLLPFQDMALRAENARTIIRSVSIDSALPPGAPTNTPTNTRTLTPTNTLTPTETNTPTATFTPSNTPTITLTPIYSYTPSNTPTITNTPTNTPTFTATFTPTIPPTPTPVCVVSHGGISEPNNTTTIWTFSAINIPANTALEELRLTYRTARNLLNIQFSVATAFWSGTQSGGTDVIFLRQSAVNDTLIKANNSVQFTFNNNNYQLSKITAVFTANTCPTLTYP